MKAAYFDCQFGAAGDMLLGALIHAGLDTEAWLKELEKIALPEGSFQIAITKVQRLTLASTKVDVLAKYPLSAAGDKREASLVSAASGAKPTGESSHNHGHDHEHGHLHSHDHSHSGTHSHEHEHPHLHEHDEADTHSHHHDHGHDHEHGHTHGHTHGVPGDGTTAMDDVLKVIEKSTVAEPARALAMRVIRRLGDCEGPVHGFAPDAVYFHEVGGIDTIVDVVGFAVAYHMMGIEKSYVSAVPIGRGRVMTAVGYFPLPAPAVALMLAKINAPTLDFEIDYECLTPTGVAILAEICSEWGKLPRFKAVTAVGSGAGTKDSPKWPNIARVMLGEI